MDVDGTDANENAPLDYSGLTRAHRATRRESERRKLEGGMREDLEFRKAALERLAPNLKVRVGTH